VQMSWPTSLPNRLGSVQIFALHPPRSTSTLKRAVKQGLRVNVKSLSLKVSCLCLFIRSKLAYIQPEMCNVYKTVHGACHALLVDT
jgi:hypothetical protein